MDLDSKRVVSSIRILNRDKNNPIDLGKGRKMYSDNVLTEVAFPPATSVEGLIDEMREVFAKAQQKLGDQFRLYPVAAYDYDRSEVIRGRKPWQIGCNPSRNAYTGLPNEIKKFTSYMRTGSFHIHIGHPDIDDDDKVRFMVKLLDIFVGCASILFDKDPSSPKRRALYGRAGEYRQTPYGLEFRVLGNWALRSPVTTKLALDLAMYALTMRDMGMGDEILQAVGEGRPQKAINENNSSLAMEVLGVSGIGTSMMDRILKDYGMPEFNVAWEI